jgi:hypothetical protein
MLRDRDSCYANRFCETVQSMGIREVLTAPQSPWQNGYAERFIGLFRREGLSDVIIFLKTGLSALSQPDGLLPALATRMVGHSKVGTLSRMQAIRSDLPRQGTTP